MIACDNPGCPIECSGSISNAWDLSGGCTKWKVDLH